MTVGTVESVCVDFSVALGIYHEIAAARRCVACTQLSVNVPTSVRVSVRFVRNDDVYST